MTTITTAKTVRELTAEIPQATRVFEKLGIDYCCHGDEPLDQACAHANVSVDQVVRALEQAEPVSESRDWRAAPLDELTAYIVDKHHGYVRNETPRLQALASKVASVHGANHPELGKVQELFEALGDELAQHMMKEERILFPFIDALAAGTAAGSPFGTVQNPIRMMMFEHDAAGEHLKALRDVTNNYAVPADGCASYAALFNGLAEFELDLHQHIHLENNILFPRAIAAENS